jgi:hypothetical protein
VNGLNVDAAAIAHDLRVDVVNLVMLEIGLNIAANAAGVRKRERGSALGEEK